MLIGDIRFFNVSLQSIVSGMNTSECDITTYVLLDCESVGMSVTHIASLEHFRDNIVRPSLRVLSEKIGELKRSDDLGDVFLTEDFNELLTKTVEGYTIAVQSMWERGLRGMLANCGSRLRNGYALEALMTATWNDRPTSLQAHFLRLIGVSIRSFSSYCDLDFLQHLGNAIRHGDGRAARWLYQQSPSLWPGWLASGQVILLESIGEENPQREATIPPFDLIKLTPVVLEQMLQSVLWFWEDIENMRCNSFRRKSDSVVRKLSSWQDDIERRGLDRVWKRK